MPRLLLALVLLATACGGPSGDPDPTSASAADSGPSTTTAAPASTPPVDAATASLDGYRFTMSLAVEPDGGEATVVSTLNGEHTTNPEATHLFGTVEGTAIDLVTDSDGWRDLAEPDLDVTEADVTQYLATTGFLRPADITSLLAEPSAWQDLGVESHLGAPVEHLRRTAITKGVDWVLGDMAQLDVWREPTGDVVKLLARWATGDNTGFPISTWEITERNPDITIPASGSG